MLRTAQADYAPPMPSTESEKVARNKEIVSRYWDALYAHDWDGIASFFTDDANYVDVGIGESGGGAYGPAQIVARLRLGLEPVPEHLHHDPVLIAEGDRVVTEHKEEWVFHTGERVMHPFTSIMELTDDGKIARWHDYSNMSNLLDNAPQWWLDHIAAGWADLV